MITRVKKVSKLFTSNNYLWIDKHHFPFNILKIILIVVLISVCFNLRAMSLLVDDDE